jgi:glycosyltransferase involved in cell wall biosynthesis
VTAYAAHGTRVAPMGRDTRLSVVLPVYNEADSVATVLESLARQRGDNGPLDRGRYELILVDNNSTDATAGICRAFAAAQPDLAVHIIDEPRQGVACARKTGMDLAAARSRQRDLATNQSRPFYLVSADADCRVAEEWLWELLRAMEAGTAAIGVCNYYYACEHFTGRPRLWAAIQRILSCRAVTFGLFGGFPDGKGFAVDRDAYEKVGGIEIFYQLRDGRFVNHLSDDWDFGIKVRASGEEITYVPASRVEINPRRVDHAIDEVIAGRAYGCDGIITMRDIRVRERDAQERPPADLTPAQARQAWEFAIKDFVPKNTILPVLLTPALLTQAPVEAFFTPSLAARLGQRIAEIKNEMRVIDFTAIHAYKTPSYRLYFEFADEIFGRLRATVGPDVGHPPPLPPCLADLGGPGETARFREYVRYYCEDRESGEAHNYFGNGGVF